MKYTKIIIVVTLLLFQLGAAQEKADVVLNKAFTEAKAGKKNVLLVFHASWCKWCKMMEKNMDLPETKPIFDKRFVTAYVDVQERGDKKSLENPGGQELMNKYKGENAGLPFWVILNPKGEVLADSFDAKGENLGSPATPEEVNSFIAKLGKASKLSNEESQTIEKVFVKK
ncbi:thioredoxin-related protein [Chryseobacterium bernardetii]|jgi:thioredoxin-related protein|uniref:Thioredoxin-like protein n=3 Tax=Chryseobacterium TaxID=59732 RepID=A0A543EMJ3_9FLAO|nr:MULTISPECIES: thioredoxin family protein [Chryseobacterium]MDR6369168.1 thioredoxin-related protein [Chryseobacterium vietnamense]MDR6439909.1 thioredoxin-related protein [Chryseobacterium bernardetii]MDR6459504.1 thioredoxin-related protein [Chryseobacterium vietnamense]MDR6487465.1 thioredoxin-related protein [Chryseobacterium vietnamense]TQM22772.1 thioredoxin-like protein [Chryseobacterium aquifrigidense]